MLVNMNWADCWPPSIGWQGWWKWLSNSYKKPRLIYVVVRGVPVVQRAHSIEWEVANPLLESCFASVPLPKQITWPNPEAEAQKNSCWWQTLKNTEASFENIISEKNTEALFANWIPGPSWGFICSFIHFFILPLSPSLVNDVLCIIVSYLLLSQTWTLLSGSSDLSEDNTYPNNLGWLTL